jgi:light-regulated signal transduction histidine kinase (bacteriophytochrome)
MLQPPEWNTDLTNCDREPIHLLGSVQPFGFLLAVARSDWTIQRVSRNVTEWLGLAPADLLGRPLASIFSSEAIHAIRGNLQSAVMGDTTARMFALTVAPGLVWDVAVHLAGDAVVIESERTLDEPSFNAAAVVRGMVARLRQAEDDRAFYRVAAREMRVLTGFDRVMVYRFDADGSGEVIAEAARSGLESYLGHHYQPRTSRNRRACCTSATGCGSSRTPMRRQRRSSPPSTPAAASSIFR